MPVDPFTPGIKFDEGKPRYDLFPPEAVEALAHLYAMGAKKYSDRNWEKGMRWGRIFSAMLSHSWKWWRGEEYDPDGQHHLDSVAWCAFALRTYVARDMKAYDDRKNDSSGSSQAPQVSIDNCEAPYGSAESVAIGCLTRHGWYCTKGSLSFGPTSLYSASRPDSSQDHDSRRGPRRD